MQNIHSLPRRVLVIQRSHSSGELLSGHSQEFRATSVAISDDALPSAYMVHAQVALLDVGAHESVLPLIQDLTMAGSEVVVLTALAAAAVQIKARAFGARHVLANSPATRAVLPSITCWILDQLVGVSALPLRAHDKLDLSASGHTLGAQETHTLSGLRAQLRLSPRMTEILAARVSGYNASEIAEVFGLSRRTIYGLSASLRRRTHGAGLDDLADAVHRSVIPDRSPASNHF